MQETSGLIAFILCVINWNAGAVGLSQLLVSLKTDSALPQTAK
jgi:hypothetical protein